MRTFKSTAPARRFLFVHGIVGNLFRVGRHLLRAVYYRLFWARALSSWQPVSGVRLNLLANFLDQRPSQLPDTSIPAKKPHAATRTLV